MATRYVDYDAGNDGNDGTSPALAWKTLGHAVANLAAAMTVYVKARAGGAAYTWTLEGEPDNLILDNNYFDNVTWEGYGTTPGDGVHPILDGEGSAQCGFWLTAADHNTVKHFTIRHCTQYGVRGWVAETYCTRFILLEDLTIHDCGLIGIYLPGGLGHAVADCSVDSCPTAISVNPLEPDPESDESSSCSVRDCSATGCTVAGIACGGDTGISGIVVGCVAEGAPGSGTGITGSTVVGCVSHDFATGILCLGGLVYACIVDDCTTGIQSGQNGPLAGIVRECIVSGCTTGLKGYAGICNIESEFNDLYDCTTDYTDATQGAHDVDVDPEYASATNYCPTAAGLLDLGALAMPDGTTTVYPTPGPGLAEDLLTANEATIDIETQKNAVRSAFFRASDVVALAGAGVTLYQAGTADVVVTIRKQADDALVATLLTATGASFAAAVPRTLAALNGDVALEWTPSAVGSYFVRVSVTQSDLGLSPVVAEQQFEVSALETTAAVDVETQRSTGERCAAFLDTHAITIGGAGVTLLDALAAVAVTVTVRAQADDSLVATLLSTSATFTSGQTKTFATLNAGAPLTWTPSSAGAYYVRVTVAHAGLGATLTAEQQFAVLASSEDPPYPAGVTLMRTGDDVYQVIQNPGRLVRGITAITGATFPFGGTSLGILEQARLRFLGGNAAFTNEAWGHGVPAHRVALPRALELRALLDEMSNEALAWLLAADAVTVTAGTSRRALEVDIDHGAVLQSTAYSLMWVPDDEDEGMWVYLPAVTQACLDDDAEIPLTLRQRMSAPARFTAQPDSNGVVWWMGPKKNLLARWSL